MGVGASSSPARVRTRPAKTSLAKVRPELQAAPASRARRPGSSKSLMVSPANSTRLEKRIAVLPGPDDLAHAAAVEDQGDTAALHGLGHGHAEMLHEGRIVLPESAEVPEQGSPAIELPELGRRDVHPQLDREARVLRQEPPDLAEIGVVPVAAAGKDQAPTAAGAAGNGGRGPGRRG